MFVRRLAKALVAVAVAGIIATVLLYLSGLASYDPNGCAGCIAIGHPVYWTIRASGYGAPLVDAGAILADFVFWFTLSSILVGTIYLLPAYLVRHTN
jgi:hypothetical protein